MQVLPQASRQGVVVSSVVCPPGNNMLEITASFGSIPAGVGFAFLIEQDTGPFWSVFAGADISDLAQTMATPGKGGILPTTLVWRFYEQIVCDCKNWASTRDYNIGGRPMKQLALCGNLRITTESYGAGRSPANLDYGFVIVPDDRIIPPGLVNAPVEA